MWRILLPYVVGLLLADYLDYTYFELSSGFFLLLSLLLLVFLPRPTPFRWRHLLGVGLLCWTVLLGYSRISQSYAPGQALHLSQQSAWTQGDEVYATGRITDQRPGTDRLRLTVDLRQLQRGDSLSPTHTRVAVSIPADSLALSLQLGHQIAFRGRIRPIAAPTNPDVFNYAGWQARQQVFHQAYLTANDWQLLDRKVSLRGWAEAQRARLLRILRQYLGNHPNEYAVAAALVLGKRDAVSEELRNAYAETGAVHVLAVSGLHLGFVLGALHLLFGWGFWRKPAWRWPRLALILLGIWLFALLTGLAPSVLRAATMFSFLEVGRQLQRKSSTYNSLAASAFLLLLLDPQLLWNIGFQLSYLAVLGILFFQPRIERWLYFRHKPARAAWSLLAVALAAQLTTFPLSLYYFHQFPVYFLLTGLFVVSLAAGILYLAVALLLLSWWPVVASLLAKLLYLLLFLNNALVFGVQSLPFGLIRAVWISATLVVLLYLSQLLLARWLQRNRAPQLLALLASIVLALTVYNWEIRTRQQQQRAIVYDLRRASAVDWMNGTEAFTSTSQLTAATVDYQLQPHREHRGIRTLRTLGPQAQYPSLWRNGPALAFRDQRWLIVDADFRLPAPATPLTVDVILLRENPRLSLGQLQDAIHAQTWVADGSNAPWRVRQWQAEADSLGLSLYNTRQKGAFLIPENTHD
jgi:competence protein ComEC